MKWSERALLRVQKHGTYTEYSKYKCRCDLCKEAGRMHGVIYRAKNPQTGRDAVKKCAHKNLNLIRTQKSKPCTDCGKTYPHYVMQFDHLKDKSFQLSDRKVRYFSKQKILSEIEKCEIVCANCHAVRTYERLSEGKEKRIS